jgi:hypothetical protein
MRRSALPIVIVACVVVAAVLAWIAMQRFFPRSSPAESGPVTSEIRTPGEFTKVDVSGHFDVELVQGPKHEVTVEAPPDVLGTIRTSVNGGRLSIRAERSGWRPFQGASRVPRIIVTAPAYEAIAAAGTIRISSASLDVDSLRLAAAGATTLRFEKFHADSLRLAGSGALKAHFAGQAREFTVSLSGAGDVRAAELVAEEAKVSVAGAGHVVVNAAKALRVSLSGAGSVEYYGNPEINKSISGIGSIKRRDGPPANAPAEKAHYQIA